MSKPVNYWMRLAIKVLCLSLGICLPLQAENSELSSKWQKIQQQIESISESIDELGSSVSTSETTIKKAEEQIARTAHEINTLEQQQHANEATIVELYKTQETLNTTQANQLKALKQHLIHYHAAQKQPPLKLLLGNLPWTEAKRQLQYKQYVTQSQIQAIQALTDRLQALLDTQHKLEIHKERLSNQTKALMKEKAALDQNYAHHQTLIKQYRKQMSSKKKSLTDYEAQSKSIASLLKKYQADTNADLQGLSYADVQLPLPSTSWRNATTSVHGNIKRVSATRGTPVYAIEDGQVAFAAWLRGLGYLIIIDHGQGFMSLYGTNEALFRSQGDTVAKGETIASVGNSGAFLKPGLYFEIRKDGQPVNFDKWLSHL